MSGHGRSFDKTFLYRFKSGEVIKMINVNVRENNGRQWKHVKGSVTLVGFHNKVLTSAILSTDSCTHNFCTY